MLITLFVLICGWTASQSADFAVEPYCLYKSELCLGKSRKWIDTYVCMDKSANEFYPYSLLHEDYIKVFHEDHIIHIDRFIGLHFDEKDELQAYRILFSDYSKRGLEKDLYYKLIFEHIGQEQLYHYTQLNKLDYREYIGIYEYANCQVEFAVPDSDPFRVEIVVTRK